MAEEKDQQAKSPERPDTSQPPISNRIRKSTKRPKKQAKPPRGSLAALWPRPTDDEPAKESAQASRGALHHALGRQAENLPDVDMNTSYSIPHHGERTELDAPLEMTAGTGEILEASIPGSSKDSQPSKMDQEYSAEARAYHARYDEVSVANPFMRQRLTLSQLSQVHDEGRFDFCREGCLDLLTEPRIPYWTRIQTLQMLSTIMKPDTADECLARADAIINLLDPKDFRTPLLRSDNNNMKADLGIWRAKRGLEGESLAEVDDADKEPLAEYFALDRDLEKKLADETEAEIEPFGRSMALRGKPAETEAAAATIAQRRLPSPEGSSEEEK